MGEELVALMRAKIPAGDYYLGDPEFTMGHGDFMEMMEGNRFYRLNPREDFKGCPVVLFYCKEAMGDYLGNDALRYYTSSGMLGLVHVGLIPKENRDSLQERFDGRFVTFDEEAEAVKWSDGRLAFGDVVIDTSRHV